MEIVMALVVGVLFGVGTYMLLRPSLIRIVMGFGLYSNAANLLLMACGGYAQEAAAPFIGESTQLHMDPLPPDIVLTAIVISFAVGALLLIICYRVYRDHGVDDPERLPSGAEG